MALRVVSVDSAAGDLATVVREVSSSRDPIVVAVDGFAMAMVVPLSEHDENEVVRQRFARFWDRHKAAMLAEPDDLTEDEVMDIVASEVAAYREEDGVAELVLGWGTPRARAWVPAAQLAQLER